MNKNFYSSVTNFLKKRTFELLGLTLILFSIALFVSFITYSPSDPSFIYGENDVTIKNCSITSRYDNSGGHALQVYNGYFGSGFTAVGNHLKVTNASANGLKVASANIGKYASNTFEGSTTAIDDASTAGNQMINTPDIYGNLLL